MSVIQQMKCVFARFGSPDLLVADNVPFNSLKFKEFANQWNFNLSFRSSYYPQSNRLAKKAVSIAKKLLKKSREERKDIGRICTSILQKLPA